MNETAGRPEQHDPAVGFVTTHRLEDVLVHLKTSYFSVLLLDLRWSPGQRPGSDEILSMATRLLDDLDQVQDLDLRYGFHRIMVLVSDHESARIDRFLLEVGSRGVGAFVRQRDGTDGHKATADSRAKFARHILSEALGLISSRSDGPRALCLSGGGITGIHFELGALKCLDDCLSGNAINTFDMYFGISAGAVVAGFLTAGFSVDECMAAVAGFEGGRMPPLDLGLLRTRHLNTAGLFHRIGQAYRSSWSTVRRVLRFQPKTSLESLAFHYSKILGPPFHSAGYHAILRGILSLPGVTNDFRKLPRKLFIGASDLDTRTHVLFGSEGLDHVPISKAIQASLSIHPIFSPVKIGDRFYADGIVTRTSNFNEAIRRDAKFVLVLDPFVPYTSRQPGFASNQGLLYNIDQDLRTASYTRFENTRNWIQRAHPEVSAYTFLPSNRIRQTIAVNAMDHRTFMEVWKEAYLSTLHRLKVILHRFQGDVQPYGLSVRLEKANVVATQLQRSRPTTFADFFPGRRVELRQPPLSLEVQSPGT